MDLFFKKINFSIAKSLYFNYEIITNYNVDKINNKQHPKSFTKRISIFGQCFAHPKDKSKQKHSIDIRTHPKFKNHPRTPLEHKPPKNRIEPFIPPPDAQSNHSPPIKHHSSFITLTTIFNIALLIKKIHINWNSFQHFRSPKFPIVLQTNDGTIS